MTSRATIGYTAIATRPMTTNQGFANLTCGASIVPEFLAYWLRHKREHLLQLASGTTFPELPKSTLKKVQIILPTIEEQLRIVNILNRAARIERLRALARERLLEFIPALFIKMFGDPVENPMGWETVRLSEIVSEFRYGTSKKCHDYATCGSLPVLRIPNVAKGAVNLDNLKHTVLNAEELQRLKLAKGDLLFVRTNGNPQYIGRCSIFDLDLDAAFASYLIRARLIDQPPVFPSVISDAMDLPSLRSVLMRLARTTAGNYNINIENLGSVELPVPATEIQKQYLSLIASLKTQIRFNFRAAYLAGDLTRSLTNQLLGSRE